MSDARHQDPRDEDTRQQDARQQDARHDDARNEAIQFVDKRVMMHDRGRIGLKSVSESMQVS